MKDRQEGFTLVEILVAFLLFTVVSLSIVPLMLRGISNNVRGAEAQHISRQIESRLEAFLQIPFDNGPMVLPTGAAEGAESEVWVHDPESLDSDWTPGTLNDVGSQDQVLWVRETRVRQYGIGDLEADADGETTLTEPIPGGERPYAVHLKLVEGEVFGTRIAGPLGAGQTSTVRVLRAY